MNLAVQILELAVALVRGLSSGAVQSGAGIALTLTDIVRIAAKAYHQQVGQAMDPSVIKTEAEI